MISLFRSGGLVDAGDVIPEPYRFRAPMRQQGRRDDIRPRSGRYSQDSITVRHGLPVITLASSENTVKDYLRYK